MNVQEIKIIFELNDGHVKSPQGGLVWKERYDMRIIYCQLRDRKFFASQVRYDHYFSLMDLVHLACEYVEYWENANC